ncbi:MAG: hypothetical protein IID08_04100 [Candidatus Hydrogenedentes bacterium]|nr:hypothetical protein [Candidatus Hydrogenedentota bacterium]
MIDTKKALDIGRGVLILTFILVVSISSYKIAKKDDVQSPAPATNIPRPPFMGEVEFGLTFDERLQLLGEIFAATAAARDEADRIAPIDDVGLDKHEEVKRELIDEYQTEACRKFGVQRSMELLSTLLFEQSLYGIWKSYSPN